MQCSYFLSILWTICVAFAHSGRDQSATPLTTRSNTNLRLVAPGFNDRTASLPAKDALKLIKRGSSRKPSPSPLPLPRASPGSATVQNSVEGLERRGLLDRPPGLPPKKRPQGALKLEQSTISKLPPGLTKKQSSQIEPAERSSSRSPPQPQRLLDIPQPSLMSPTSRGKDVSEKVADPSPLKQRPQEKKEASIFEQARREDKALDEQSQQTTPRKLRADALPFSPSPHADARTKQVSIDSDLRLSPARPQSSALIPHEGLNGWNPTGELGVVPRIRIDKRLKPKQAHYQGPST